jgi:hypothetical protein
MKKLLLMLLAFAGSCAPLFAQGAFIPPQTALKNINGIAMPIANATITVCGPNAGGIPCSPALLNTVYKDIGLTQPLPNPFTSDVNGNYQFAAASATYTVTVTAPGFGGYSYQVTMGEGGGLPNGSTPFTNQKSVTLANPYGNVAVIPICVDFAGNVTYPVNVNIQLSSVLVTFQFASTGYCVLNGSGGAGGVNILPLANTFTGSNNISILNGNINPLVCGAASPPSWCSGSDRGAWINSAVAALPTVALNTVNSGTVQYPSGTIEIPNTGGIQTFSTPIGTGVLLSLVTIRCDPGTTLQYTGSGPDWIDALDPNGLNDTASGGVGGIVGCTFIAPVGPVANQRIIHYGNVAVSYKLQNDYFQGMTATGDSALYIENTNYFTEELDTSGSSFHQNTVAITLSKNCGSAPNCTNSFQHTRLNFYCQTAFAEVSYCLQVLNGASSFKDTLAIDSNIVGSSGSAVVYVDGTSTFGYNVGTITAENQTGGNGYALVGPGVTAGGAFSNGLHVYCAVCNLPFAAADVPYGLIDTFGSYSAPTVIGSYAASLLQQNWFNSISCRNVTGGSCTTAPTITVSGGTISQSVVCPTTQTNVTTSGSVGSPEFINPGNAVTLTVSSAGSSCTAPKFNVTLQMWGW